MHFRFCGTTLLAFLLTSLPITAQGPFGSIQDLKLAKPDDAKDILSTPAPDKAIVLFDGKNLENWTQRDGKKPAAWKLVDNAMQVQGGDIISKQKFAGRFKLHVEFRVPYMPTASGQGRGNSGVYLQGRYEVQVLDSYGLKSRDNDCGGIYGIATPLVNACKAPTVWQSYDILYEAPKCAAGKPSDPAIITVLHNGVKIHDNIRIARKKGDQEEIVTNTTSGLGGDPCSPGPILLQDHGNPVQYRNIWILQES